MLVVYILTKARELKVKILRKTDSGIFRYKDFEYHIDRKKIYQKKFLNWKPFFFSMYLEGNPNAMEFDDEKGYRINECEVPLDEIAIILRKIRRGVEEIVILILTGGTFLMVLMLLIKIYEVQ